MYGADSFLSSSVVFVPRLKILSIILLVAMGYNEFLRLLSAAGNTITWELVKIKSYKHPNTWQT